MSTDDSVSANDLGGADDMLSPMEALDSDDVLNDDGDEVVDPPEDWVAADKYGMTAEEEREGESLDERLAAEEPDVTEAADARTDADTERAEGGGRHRGQVDGAPEDGESLFTVVEE